MTEEPPVDPPEAPEVIPDTRLADFIQDNRHLLLAALLALGILLFWVLAPASVRDALADSLASQRPLTVMLLVFSLLSLSLLWSAGQKLDAWVFLFVNLRAPRNRWLDYFMLGVTQFGNGLLAFSLAIAFYLNGNHRFAYEIVLGTMTLWLVVELFKAMIRRSRPYVHIEEARILGWRARGKSFPSGHTSQSFFLVFLLAHHFPFGWAWVVLLYSLAVVIGVTRMYVGAHYPRDVVAGALLGSVWGILAALVDIRLIGRLP